MAARALDTARIADLMLSRIFYGGQDGVTTKQVQNDLKAFVSHRLSDGQWQ